MASVPTAIAVYWGEDLWTRVTADARKAGVSVCHYQYGPETMSAAACGPLRAALPSWRGRTVTVSREGHGSVAVKLVDYCASTDKTIDLYWKAMNALGGTGVISVVVSW